MEGVNSGEGLRALPAQAPVLRARNHQSQHDGATYCGERAALLTSLRGLRIRGHSLGFEL